MLDFFLLDFKHHRKTERSEVILSKVIHLCPEKYPKSKNTTHFSKHIFTLYRFYPYI
jgi:hypothetical protein